MEGDPVRVVGAHVLDPEFVYQELRKLEHFGGYSFDLFGQFRIIGQSGGVRVEFPDHPDAGTGGRDDCVVGGRICL